LNCLWKYWWKCGKFSNNQLYSMISYQSWNNLHGKFTMNCCKAVWRIPCLLGIFHEAWNTAKRRSLKEVKLTIVKHRIVVSHLGSLYSVWNYSGQFWQGMGAL
jgi:hypothetical protein